MSAVRRNLPLHTCASQAIGVALIAQGVFNMILKDHKSKASERRRSFEESGISPWGELSFNSGAYEDNISTSFIRWWQRSDSHGTSNKLYIPATKRGPNAPHLASAASKEGPFIP